MAATRPLSTPVQPQSPSGVSLCHHHFRRRTLAHPRAGQPLLERPTEWPSREPIVFYHDFAYQAQSWSVPRRVVAKVEWHQGELFPRVGFIVTNLSYPPKGVVRFYNGRGTAEQWVKEGKYALNWTRLSCHKFVANQVRLWHVRPGLSFRGRRQLHEKAGVAGRI